MHSALHILIYQSSYRQDSLYDFSLLTLTVFTTTQSMCLLLFLLSFPFLSPLFIVFPHLASFSIPSCGFKVVGRLIRPVEIPVPRFL